MRVTDIDVRSFLNCPLVMASAKTYKIANVDCDLFNTSTPEVRKVIVEIGCGVYKNLECLTSVVSKDNECQVQERIDMLLSNKAKTIEYLNRELDEFNAKKEEEVNTWRIRTDELKEELQQCRGEFEANKNAELSRYENACAETFKSLRDQIAGLESLRDIQEKQLKALDKSKNMKTVELGIAGEQSVMEYIGQTFSEGVLQDTTKKGGFGDIHFQYKNVNMLIEVKNKDNITLDDLSKFKRDILETKSHGGIFVSVKTGVNIPCHSNYDVEWLNNVPIIYITQFDACPSTLYTSIKTIHFYVTNVCASVTESEECKRKREEFDTLMDIVRCFSCSIDDLIMDTKRISDRLNKLQNVIKDKVDLQVEKETMSYIDTVMSLFRSYEIAHKELPNEEFLTNHGMARSVIKELGGIKELRKQYNAQK